MTKRIAFLFCVMVVLLGIGAWQGNPYITTPTLIAPVITNGLTAIGSVANDFSASTGAFKTSSGANTLSGAVTIPVAGSGLTMGVAGSALGQIIFDNLTSGSITLTPVAGALGGSTLTLPAATDTLVGKATSDSFTNKTFATAGVGFTNATSGTITLAAPTGALGTPTNTLPANTGGLPAAYDCGSTGSGNQTCAPAAVNGQFHEYYGHSTLASNAAIITFPIAFTSTTTFDCVANDITTRANVVQMVPSAANTATITNTTGASDVIQWHCGGQ